MKYLRDNSDFSLFYLYIKMDLEMKLNLEGLTSGSFKVDAIRFQKMLFVSNALENGWSVKKRNGAYIFTKSHENKREIFNDEYLGTFMKMNLDLSKFLTTNTAEL